MNNRYLRSSSRSLTAGVLSIALSLGSLASLSAAPPELKTQGNQVVVKATGTPIRLTGVNIPSLEWGNGDHMLFPSIDVAVAEWKSNVIRLPVSQARFNAGGAYLTTVDTFIEQASAAGVYVILDCHEYLRPTNATTTFWISAANRYKNNPAVLFGLLNEPHSITWEVWRDGDAEGPGMQDLIDTIRATGALNIVLAGGKSWGYELSGVLQGYALTDVIGNGIIYDSHVYPWKTSNQFSVANVARIHPVLLGELGHPGVTTYLGMTFEHHSTWVPKIMDWVNTHNLHWTGWSFHPGASPLLISDNDFTPTHYWGATALANLQSYRNPSALRVVGGKVIGSTGTRSNPGTGVVTDTERGAVVAFNDGHLGYFDGPTANGSWTGLDLGSAKRITRIDYMPRTNYGTLMVGGVFQGASNESFTSGLTTLHTITSAPVHTGGIYTTANVTNTGTYRYVRYVGPNGSYGNVASLLFYTGDGGGSGSGGTDVIVDNLPASGVVITGSWFSSSTPGFYGSNAIHDNNTGKGSKTVRFTPHLAVAGNYEVFARWTSHENRASNVPIDISHGGGTDFVEVNQKSDGGQWVPLGIYPFPAGTVGNVLISNHGTSGFVMADAVRFVRSAEVILDNDDLIGVTKVGNWTSTTTAGFYGTESLHDSNTGKGTKSVRFTPNLIETRNYEVYLWWTANLNREVNVPVDIVTAQGNVEKRVNQREYGGEWRSLGIHPFNAGTDGSVLIRTDGTTGFVVVDAVRFVPR